VTELVMAFSVRSPSDQAAGPRRHAPAGGRHDRHLRVLPAQRPACTESRQPSPPPPFRTIQAHDRQIEVDPGRVQPSLGTR